MKKLGISFLAFCSLFAMSLFPIDVHATDFEGQEDKYIKICSSNLTNSNKKVCQEFNKYLKEKNQDLKEEIQDTKDDLSEKMCIRDSLISSYNEKIFSSCFHLNLSMNKS